MAVPSSIPPSALPIAQTPAEGPIIDEMRGPRRVRIDKYYGYWYEASIPLSADQPNRTKVRLSLYIISYRGHLMHYPELRTHTTDRLKTLAEGISRPSIVDHFADWSDSDDHIDWEIKWTITASKESDLEKGIGIVNFRQFLYDSQLMAKEVPYEVALEAMINAFVFGMPPEEMEAERKAIRSEIDLFSADAAAEEERKKQSSAQVTPK